MTSLGVATWAGQCEVATRTSVATWTLFRSLFGSLFMGTVHKHCSQGFKKKKKEYKKF